MSASSDEPFEYASHLIDDCAASNENTACEILYNQHAKHYGRRQQEHDAQPARFQRFLETVRLVHQHNQRSDVGHKITLNQFSDLTVEDLPLSAASNEQSEAVSSSEELWKQAGFDMEVDLIQLSSDDAILEYAAPHDRGQRNLRKHHHGSSNKNRHGRHHRHENNDDDEITVQVDPNSDNKWSTLDSTVGGEGHQVHIKATTMELNNHYRYDDDDNGSATTAAGATVETDDAVDVVDDYDTFLNWSTEDNPDGVSIVHNASDQGSCGSCWAFAATGTLEASASRRVANEAYKNHLTLQGNAEVEDAEWVAKQSEQDAIRLANLSVQELIDCDNAIDQGCTGGNPLLAFYFIHRYGITSTLDYPYSGEQTMCHVRRVADPIATSQSWGILTMDHEDNMETVLRWIGPIAVGVNGSDPAFLAYKHGIYDNPLCGQQANHAMLIVGYGQQVDPIDGTIVRYWIARNSWGQSWGENGYVRVKRGSGVKGEAGVCGISKNPSVSLGGVLLPKSGIHSIVGPQDSDRNVNNNSERLEESLLTNYCGTIGLGDLQTCHRIEGLLQVYPAFTYGIISVFAVILFVVFPLTSDCRARSRRREIRRRLMLENGDHGESALQNSESETLLAEADNRTSYGSSKVDNA